MFEISSENVSAGNQQLGQFSPFDRYLAEQAEAAAKVLEPFTAQSEAIRTQLSRVIANSRLAEIASQQSIFNEAMANLLADFRAGSPRQVQAEKIEPLAFSADMKKATSPIEPFETVIESTSQFVDLIEQKTELFSEFSVVWRGQANADWGLHSGLYRKLIKEQGIDNFKTGAKKSDLVFPNEDELMLAEQKLLDIARKIWRHDGTSALEIMATLQHLGAPTRLIDITTNPLVALYFATGNDPLSGSEKVDGRVFIFATNNSNDYGGSFLGKSRIELSGIWDSYSPPWHGLKGAERGEFSWGTGANRRVWFPPQYLQRIPAQSAGFLLDGVPIWTNKTASSFKKSVKPAQTYWNRAEILSSSSIYSKFYRLDGPKPRTKQWQPTFTLRIPAENKGKIRNTLDRTFGINIQTLFPDSPALAEFLRNTNFSEGL